MTAYASPDDIPNPYKAKLVIVYAQGLKIYGQIPYLLARRLHAIFVSNQNSFMGGGTIWFPSAEDNFTAVPWRRPDGEPHSPETIQALTGWLQSGKGAIYLVAAPENFNDSLTRFTPWRGTPKVWQPKESDPTLDLPALMRSSAK